MTQTLAESAASGALEVEWEPVEEGQSDAADLRLNPSWFYVGTALLILSVGVLAAIVDQRGLACG